jgi:hypothetical protein
VTLTTSFEISASERPRRQLFSVILAKTHEHKNAKYTVRRTHASWNNSICDNTHAMIHSPLKSSIALQEIYS